MNNATKEYDIFLSYAHADESWVAEFAHALQKVGIRAFSPAQVRSGDSWVDTLEAALRQSDTLIVFFSPNSLENPNVYFELGAALAGDKRIIPVLVGNVSEKQLPFSLASQQQVRSASPSEAANQVAQILEASA